MTPEQIQKMADGLPPHSIGKDHEEVVTHLAKQHIALQQQVNALAAENATLKSGIGFFSYGTDSGFEEHDSAEKAIAAADSDIDYYRGDACDGWSEKTDQTVWGVIMQRATVTGLRAVTKEDALHPSIKEWCDYTLLPNIETPATDAYLNSVRADGVKCLQNTSGFITAMLNPTLRRLPPNTAPVSREAIMIDLKPGMVAYTKTLSLHIDGTEIKYNAHGALNSQLF